ncbi:MAG: bifunctional diaminohydroxyphosphoribosylaminopyrimidine deaminase/5-amino-6-(5-phosphoribosylamino)uracil reductase RibD [Firmicutes bacterium]|nr:bifunctional diaminohydroxyphosphoribosylaminopyrimidine deaminase/5-amino-6-(5-phosphoribosylamino)uracil reductase RibD [Bacillota bacterium]
MDKNKEEYMAMAAELAKKGEGAVDPNPLVGAVIVKNGNIIGSGYHEKFGGPHAEVNAIESCKEDTEGAEIYVTLEPCSHYGKTPPCALKLIEKGFKKVYVGCLDPNPLVAGRGIKLLRDHGIEVETGVLEEECSMLNPVFFKYITQKIPYVALKSAVSLDGKTATYSGESKWISCEGSRLEVQKLRNKYMAIMVGVNTVIKDDPRLDCRIEGGRDPIKIIADTNLRTPINARMLTKGTTYIAASQKHTNSEKAKALEEKGAKILYLNEKDGEISLSELLEKLGKLNINSLLVEGGGTLNFAFIKEKLFDIIHYYIAPKIIGGAEAKTFAEGKGFETMAEVCELEFKNIRNIDGDIYLEAFPRR